MNFYSLEPMIPCLPADRLESLTPSIKDEAFLPLPCHWLRSRILSCRPRNAGNPHRHSCLLLSFKYPCPRLYEITLVGFFFLSVWISENAERFFGKKDDQKIVIDEIIGFLITMLWVPRTLLFVIIGFFLFRFFDILKPFPIRRLEKGFKGGFGVVLDDVVAGVYGNIILHLIS